MGLGGTDKRHNTSGAKKWLDDNNDKRQNKIKK